MKARLQRKNHYQNVLLSHKKGLSFLKPARQYNATSLKLSATYADNFNETF